MITVTIWRSTLVRRVACRAGLALFDSIAAMQPESDPRRLRRIRLPRYGALHWVMLVQAGYGEWLACKGIVPRANLTGTNLAGVNLTGVNLTGANLYGTDLSRANLYGAKLSRADLSAADLSHANLSDTNLSGADLNGVDLSHADLSGADLSGASLSDANLYGAYRGLGQPSIPGWRTDAAGYLEREK